MLRVGPTTFAQDSRAEKRGETSGHELNWLPQNQRGWMLSRDKLDQGERGKWGWGVEVAYLTLSALHGPRSPAGALRTVA